ncbi:MAG TPA: TIGR04325 family methyltransferase [Polyangia bacterium]|nr:TIGR04325 family methyltransferase [Polyangia bacterium]
MTLRKRVAQVVKDLPPLSTVRRFWHESRFCAENAHGAFRGVYRSFAEARAAAPRGHNVGFDHHVFAGVYPDRLRRIFAYDYPVLFWLKPLLAGGPKIFDIGGHVGLHYYAFPPYLPDLPGISWTVCDVPSVAQAGRRLAADRGDAANMSFTSELRDVAGHDVVLASGSLQYIESPSLAELLGSLASRPRHLLLNKLPLHDRPTFVTLQNAKVTFTPCRMLNRAEFLGSLAALGYRVIDTWEVPERDHYIPMHPDRSFGAASGMYLALGDEAGPSASSRLDFNRLTAFLDRTA